MREGTRSASPVKPAHGIPTLYAGIRFRSRAEARWAAFFDLCHWPWSYEPLDLAGYIPDFVLNFHQPLLVEVKGGCTTAEELRPHVAKIERSGWDGEILLLPASFQFARDAARTCDHEFDALLGERVDFGASRWGIDRPVFGMCTHHDGPGLSHSLLSYACRVCGACDGNPVHDMGEAGPSWFARACNVTAWQPDPQMVDTTIPVVPVVAAPAEPTRVFASAEEEDDFLRRTMIEARKRLGLDEKGGR